MAKVLSIFFLLSFTTLTYCCSETRTFPAPNGEFVLEVYYGDWCAIYTLKNSLNEKLWERTFTPLIGQRPKVSNTGIVAAPSYEGLFLIRPDNTMTPIVPISNDSIAKHWWIYCRDKLSHQFAEDGKNYLVLANIDSISYIFSFDPTTGSEQWRKSINYNGSRIIMPHTILTKDDKVILGAFGYSGCGVRVSDSPAQNMCVILNSTNGKLLMELQTDHFSFIVPPFWHEENLILSTQEGLQAYDMKTMGKAEPPDIQTVINWLSESNEEKAEYALWILNGTVTKFSLTENEVLSLRSFLTHDYKGNLQLVANQLLLKLDRY